VRFAPRLHGVADVPRGLAPPHYNSAVFPSAASWSVSHSRRWGVTVFSRVLRIRTGDPVFRPLPCGLQPLPGAPHGCLTQQPLRSVNEGLPIHVIPLPKGAR
jgi:hypothetical protein